MNIVRRFLFKYVYQNWNIAIADISDNLLPYNIKWMKHGYNDRWFADPFIVDESESEFIILVEEYLRDTRRGRLARLTVSKDNCELLKNETILDLDTHLSFPNITSVDGKTYLYPENAASGATYYYQYSHKQMVGGGRILLQEKLADAVIYENKGIYYLLATVGKECNGNKLIVYRSNNPFDGYKKSQEISFDDNVARRAGNVFQWNGKFISPAQVCNNDYGEGISLQEISVENGVVSLKEIKRIMPLTKEYPEGFHTFNVWTGRRAVIDGYKYGSKLLHDIYFRIRK